MREQVEDYIHQMMLSLNGVPYKGMEQDIASLVGCSREWVRQRMKALGYITWNTVKPINHCQNCHQTINMDSKYCSPDCTKEYWYLKLNYFYICQWCGEVKQIKQGDIYDAIRGRSKSLSFCSHECRNQALKQWFKTHKGRIYGGYITHLQNLSA